MRLERLACHLHTYTSLTQQSILHAAATYYYGSGTMHTVRITVTAHLVYTRCGYAPTAQSS